MHFYAIIITGTDPFWEWKNPEPPLNTPLYPVCIYITIQLCYDFGLPFPQNIHGTEQ